MAGLSQPRLDIPADILGPIIFKARICVKESDADPGEGS